MLSQFFIFAFCMGVVLWHEGPDFRGHIKVAAGAFAAVIVLRWLYQQLKGSWKLACHRRRVDELEAFTRRLEDGRIEHLAFEHSGLAIISGKLAGHRLRLTVRKQPPHAVYELWVPNNPVTFDVTRPSPIARLRGQQAKAPPVLRSARHQARLDEAVVDLFGGQGLHWLVLDESMLRAEKVARPSDLRLGALFSTFASLERIARICRRTEVQVRVLPGSHLAWSAAGALRCPYCHDTFDCEESGLASCPGCRTIHHGDCFDEAGGCTLLGCTRAPSADQRRWRQRHRRSLTPPPSDPSTTMPSYVAGKLAPHRTAPHRTAPHRTAPHRT